MDKTTTGQENLYYELESPKKESEAQIYDDVAADIDDTTTPATTRTSYEDSFQGDKAKKMRSAENASQSDTVLIRRLVFISTAVVAVAFLTAAATLILALSIMMSRNGNTSSKADLKDSGAIYGTKLASELKEMKENNSYAQSLLLAAVANLKIRMNKIEETISSGNCNKSKLSSDNNQEKNTTELWLAIQISSKRIDKLFALLPAVNASMNEKLIDVQQEIVQLDRKVNEIKKLGFNGSQGPTGPAGQGAPDSIGPQGTGVGNFSQCVHKTSSNSGSQDKVTNNRPGPSVTAVLEESNGKRIVGATCSTDIAQMYLLSTAINPADGHLFYYCKCYGHYGSGSETVTCTMHYWECPLTT